MTSSSAEFTDQSCTGYAHSYRNLNTGAEEFCRVLHRHENHKPYFLDQIDWAVAHCILFRLIGCRCRQHCDSVLEQRNIGGHSAETYGSKAIRGRAASRSGAGFQLNSLHCHDFKRMREEEQLCSRVHSSARTGGINQERPSSQRL
jgi:hypothetical protein